jgi:hypothetical protein
MCNVAAVSLHAFSGSAGHACSRVVVETVEVVGIGSPLLLDLPQAYLAGD